VRFFFRGEGALFLDRRPDEATLEALSESAHTVYDFLAAEGAALLADVTDGVGLRRPAAQEALVELVLAGLVTNDSLAALRAVLGYEPPPAARRAAGGGLRSSLAAELAARLAGSPRHFTPGRLRDARRRAREAAFAAAYPAGLVGRPGWAAGERWGGEPSRAGGLGGPGVLSGWTGRWSLVHRPGLLGKPLDEGERAVRQTRQLLARWGVVTRAALEREAPALRWEALLPVLSQLELRGEVRRGYFVVGLPGLQFALPEVVERLRAVNGERTAGTYAGRGGGEDDGGEPVVLSAADPAQLYGSDLFGGPLRFPRLATTAVALIRGEPVAALEDSGGSVVADAGHPALVAALRALARWWALRLSGTLRVRVERWGGEPVLPSAGAPLLEAAGFVRDAGAMLWVGRGEGDGRG
jgi:ATP-dependent Lhr-like helicase